MNFITAKDILEFEPGYYQKARGGGGDREYLSSVLS